MNGEKYALLIEYDGTAYRGWQRQENAPSVQQVVERAVAHFTLAPVTLWGASRTDAGVHARGQVAHFISPTTIPPARMPLAFNTVLPPDVRVRAACRAPEDFHARYDAKAKMYRYRFYNARHMSALARLYAMHVPVLLDEERMRAEAQAMLGTHDFAAFAASGSQIKNTTRTIAAVSITREGPLVELCVRGNGFLYNMVRILAGTLCEVGMGKRAPGAIRHALEEKNRLALGVTAPAHGLTLERIWYDTLSFEGDEIEVRHETNAAD